jgi:hypothetical protein
MCSGGIPEKTYFRHTVFDHLLAGQIGLVTNEQLVYSLRSITVDLLEPLLDIREGV